MCWKMAPNITAMVNLLLKPPKRSNGLKGNYININKTAAPKQLTQNTLPLNAFSEQMPYCVYIQTEMAQFPD